MPTGRLREWPAASNRADVIIVSKCPQELEQSAMAEMKQKLKVRDHQQLYFSYYHYDRLYNIFNPVDTAHIESFDSCLVVSAIAQTDYLINYLEMSGMEVHDISFEDHHKFSNYEIARIIKVFQEMESENKVLITTEKDAMRMELHKGYFLEHDVKVFALPVRVRFHKFEDRNFDDSVRSFLLEFKV
jgi:tetraacyldisaccharide 4'-kinase